MNRIKMHSTLFFKEVPLAERMRPKTIEDFVGQKGLSKNFISKTQSMVLWGPPGSGKTSFARLIMQNSTLQKFSLSAVVSGTAKFKEIFDIAEKGENILLLLDEIHHLNKSQQDIFLPHLENGNIILIGTTTENPSFELRPALLSRCKVMVFQKLSVSDLLGIAGRTERELGRRVRITKEAMHVLCEMSEGDARYLLNRIEELINHDLGHDLDISELNQFIDKKMKTYDKNGDEHYNLISAFHKSVRGSDVDAALYWFARMLQGGENPLYIARRIVRIATEDIGTADPQALSISLNASNAYQFLGSPEGELALAEAVVYVATAPKSNAVYVAYNKVRELVANTPGYSPPKHILNAPTKLMKDCGYNDGYKYDHDYPNAFSGQDFFPKEIAKKTYYIPNDRGNEKEISYRMKWWKSEKQKKMHKNGINN